MHTTRSGGTLALFALALTLLAACGGAPLMPRDGDGGGDATLVDACARNCTRDTDCCRGEVCHPSFKACVPPCGVFGMPCCTSGAACVDGLTCITSAPGGPTCAPQP